MVTRPRWLETPRDAREEAEEGAEDKAQTPWHRSRTEEEEEEEEEESAGPRGHVGSAPDVEG